MAAISNPDDTRGEVDKQNAEKFSEDQNRAVTMENESSPLVDELPGTKMDANINEQKQVHNKLKNESKEVSNVVSTDDFPARISLNVSDNKAPNEKNSEERQRQNEANSAGDSYRKGAKDENEAAPNINKKESADEEETVEIDKDDDDDEEFLASLPEVASELSGEERLSLYHKGTKLQHKSKPKSALKCFLMCLKGLDKTQNFPMLAACLRRIASIYYSLEEYSKAVQFIQAEKIYYETAIVDAGHRQTASKLDENESREEDNEDNAEALRATEYEALSKLCLKNEQAQLALEYQGKATKLRKQVYGEQHPKTLASLDQFTVVYGEVGKQQYTESLHKYTSDPAEPVKAVNKEMDKKESFSDEVGEDQTEETRNKELLIGEAVLWVLFGVAFAVLVIVLLYLYCQLDPHSRTCAAWRADLHYWYMWIKFHFYQYISSKEKVG